MASTRPDLVALGAVTRPHGVRGEVRVHRFNPDSSLLLERTKLWLRREDEVRLLDVEAARPHGDVVLVRFAGVPGRTEAEALRGFEVCVPRAELPPLEEDEFYHVDLIGLAVVSADGAEVGTVSDVVQYPASECLVVRGAEGVLEVPLSDPYVTDIDVEARRVTVAYLEDLEPVRSKRA